MDSSIIFLAYLVTMALIALSSAYVLRMKYNSNRAMFVGMVVAWVLIVFASILIVYAHEWYVTDYISKLDFNSNGYWNDDYAHWSEKDHAMVQYWMSNTQVSNGLFLLLVQFILAPIISMVVVLIYWTHSSSENENKNA